MNYHNKQKSVSLYQNPQQPRFFDKLENIYNSDAHHNQQDSKNVKHLYYKLIEKNEQQKNQKKSLQKQVNQIQNQQIDSFWKNRQRQLQQRQRRKKQMIEQTRTQNQNLFAKKLLSKSMVMPTSLQMSQNQYYEDQMQYERRKNYEKQQKQIFLREGQMINDFKNYQKQMENGKIIQSQRKKLIQNQQIQQKRLQQLDKWKKKHLQFHNQQAFNVWNQAIQQRKIKEDSLENYIVYQGAQQLNQRTARMKNEVFERQQSKRENFITELHSQVEENEKRNMNNLRNQKEQQRKLIEQRNQFIAQKNKYEIYMQNEQNKEHLSVLKSQIKPRNIQPEKQQVSFPGIGSPVHIGKTLADDRRRQLEWLEKNLYRELSK